MLTLFQAEWCPHSHAVRSRLTELGVDVQIRQVEPRPEQREELRAASGDDQIPQLVTEDGAFLAGEEAILRYLDGRCEEPDTVRGHRAQARAHAA